MSTRAMMTVHRHLAQWPEWSNRERISQVNFVRDLIKREDPNALNGDGVSLLGLLRGRSSDDAIVGAMGGMLVAQGANPLNGDRAILSCELGALQAVLQGLFEREGQGLPVRAMDGSNAAHLLAGMQDRHVFMITHWHPKRAAETLAWLKEARSSDGKTPLHVYFDPRLRIEPTPRHRETMDAYPMLVWVVVAKMVADGLDLSVCDHQGVCLASVIEEHMHQVPCDLPGFSKVVSHVAAMARAERTAEHLSEMAPAPEIKASRRL